MFETILDDERVFATAGASPGLLERTVAHVAGVAARDVTITHRCPRCGSTSHGAPSAGLPLFVSRSRAAGIEAAAASRVVPVGIDIESVARLGLAPVEDVLLHRGEAVAIGALSGRERSRILARTWTAKEAVLKLAGIGLAVDPRELRLVLGDNGFELVEWPAVLRLTAPPELRGFELGADIVGTVALARD